MLFLAKGSLVSHLTLRRNLCRLLRSAATLNSSSIFWNFLKSVLKDCISNKPLHHGKKETAGPMEPRRPDGYSQATVLDESVVPEAALDFESEEVQPE